MIDSVQCPHIIGLSTCELCLQEEVEELEKALLLVLDCYAAQIPTPGKDIQAAMDLVRWKRTERYS